MITVPGETFLWVDDFHTPAFNAVMMIVSSMGDNERGTTLSITYGGAIIVVSLSNIDSVRQPSAWANLSEM